MLIEAPQHSRACLVHNIWGYCWRHTAQGWWCWREMLVMLLCAFTWSNYFNPARVISSSNNIVQYSIWNWQCETLLNGLLLVFSARWLPARTAWNIHAKWQMRRKSRSVHKQLIINSAGIYTEDVFLFFFPYLYCARKHRKRLLLSLSFSLSFWGPVIHHCVLWAASCFRETNKWW